MSLCSWKLSAVLIIFLLGHYADSQTSFGFWQPDFVSPWLSLQAQNASNCVLTVDHGLGAVPILVDVQVRSTHPELINNIFPGIGALPRDDDYLWQFGGVSYIYNDVSVIVMAPNRNNQHASGASIYTTNGNYINGPVLQWSLDVLVRVRAWKAGSLPIPDFRVTDIPVQAVSTNMDEMFVERDHSLGNFPALVRVRTRLHTPGEWWSDAVGSTLFVGNNPKARFVTFGFSNTTIRVWIPSQGYIFDAFDATQNYIRTVNGSLEILAWKSWTVMKPKLSIRFPIGPGVQGEHLHQSLAQDSSGETAYISVWAECLRGNNAGFRFPGGGSLSYTKQSRDSVCSHGGLTYSYSVDSLMLWRPTATSYGGVICIASVMANGTMSQRELDADIVVNVWSANILHISGQHKTPPNSCNKQ